MRNEAAADPCLNGCRPFLEASSFAPRLIVSPLENSTAQLALYCFGGLIMMCAPAVPGDISHGALSLALVDSPVDSGVAKGT